MAGFVDSLLEGKSSSEDSAETVAIFTHGIAIKCFLRRILGAAPTFATHCDCPNTSITELRYKPGAHNLDGWIVVRVSDASHLEEFPDDL